MVLFERNADDRMLIASTTKIMTALVVLDYCDPQETVTVLTENTLVEGSSMYLRAGDKITVLDLLYGMLLASGNDAALALATHTGGSVAVFAELMNKKAMELGLQNSSFKNPHGLDADGHFSSARDLAIITNEAMKDEIFVQIVGSKTHKVGDFTYVNHNKLLWNYSGTLGVKTGYTRAAGRSLVSCAERDGERYIVVTLNDPNDWSDHQSLYDWAFESYTYESVLPPGEYMRLPVVSGRTDTVGVAPVETLKILLKKGAEMSIRTELPRFVYADVHAGQTAGSVIVSVDGKVAGIVKLCYTESVEVMEGMRLTPWERFKRAWLLSGKYDPTHYGYYYQPAG